MASTGFGAGSGEDPRGAGDQLDIDGDTGKPDLEAENARLAGENRRLKEREQRIVPHLKLYKKLTETKEGQEILRKVDAGEELTPKEAAKADAAAGGGDDEKPLTRKELKDAFGSFRQELAEDQRVNETSKQLQGELNTWAQKEFGDNYEKVSKTKGWGNKLAALQLTSFDEEGNVAVDIPKEYGNDIWRYIYAQAWQWTVSGDPDVAKKAPPEETNLEAAKRVAGGPRRGGRAGSSDADESLRGLPKETQDRVQRIRRIGQNAVVGKPFSR